MRIVGLDAAADLANFGRVVCRYAAGMLELVEAGVLRDDRGVEALARLLADGSERTLIAIDAPLGWPAALGRVLGSHRAGQLLPASANELFRRRTDRWVKQVIGKQPLDIGADKIARASWQALNVLDQLRSESGRPIPLAWRPDFDEAVAVIEVYPAASLEANGLSSKGYKDPLRGTDARGRLSGALAWRAPWLAGLVGNKVDVFDAGLCAIAGADFVDGCAAVPEDLALAQQEGWIWVRRPRQDEVSDVRSSSRVK
jgi:predicted nuclease with RNAse H fold